jgi:hypothetical protein
MLSDASYQTSLPRSDLARRTGFDKSTSIADMGGVRAAWFKGSEGNLVGIVQQP